MRLYPPVGNLKEAPKEALQPRRPRGGAQKSASVLFLDSQFCKFSMMKMMVLLLAEGVLGVVLSMVLAEEVIAVVLADEVLVVLPWLDVHASRRWVVVLAKEGLDANHLTSGPGCLSCSCAPH